MLKLIQNEVPTGTINGVNKVFKTAKIVGYIQSVKVDGVVIPTAYTWDSNLTITMTVAPVTSITITYFYRDVGAIRGNGEVTLGDLKDDFYRKIGRLNENGTIPTNLNRIYPEAYVKDEIRKSFKRITNKSPEANRIQQYSTVITTGATVIGATSDNVITLEQSLTNDIEGAFYVGTGILYEYYSISSGKYQIRGTDLSEVGDKVLRGSKIPVGVQKISTVRVEGIEVDWVDEREFYMGATKCYTILKDFQNNSYLFLPYSDESQVITIKYVPDLNYFQNDDDILDISEEYTDVIVYDTAYRLLKEKEDDRWIGFREELGDGKRFGLLYEYQAYIKSQIKKTKTRIGFANTY